MRTCSLFRNLTLLVASAAVAQDCLPWQDSPHPAGTQEKEQARAWLRQSAREHGSDPHEHMRLGSLLFEGKCYDLALSELLRARSQGETGVPILLKLASTENMLGAFSDAAADADAAFESATSAAEKASAAALAAVAFEGAAQPDLAIDRFGQSLQLEPKQEAASLELAKLLAQQGKQEQAAAVLEQHVTKYPGSVEAWAQLAAVQASLHNAKRALACWNAIARLRPDYPMVDSMRAQAMLAQEQPDANAVLRVVAGAEAKTPMDADLFYSEGRARLLLGQTGEAARAFETAVHLQPLETSYRYQLGLTYRKLQRFDLAEKQFTMLRRLLGQDASP